MNADMNIEYIKKPIPKSLSKVGIIFTLIGIVLFIISYVTDGHRAGFNNILVFAFLTSIALGSLFLIALEYLTGAVWGVIYRRFVEASAGLVFIIPLIAIPILINIGHIFHWAEAILQPELSDHLLDHKRPYLNITFFIIRNILFFVIWILFYLKFISNSRKQDVSKDQLLTKKNITLSAIFLPFFAITITLTAIDWLMSLEPHWFSTIFGVYYFSGSVLAALALATFFIIFFYERNYFPFELNDDHFYSLGALLFAFTNFWAYIAFSQFLLIWYANLPEENFWFFTRWENGWIFISLGLILIRFVVPYFALLSQPSKSNVKRLKIISLWILFAHLFDLYWLVMPELDKGVTFSFYEIASIVTIIGIVLLSFSYFIEKSNLIPIGDPKLKRSIEFHL